MHAVTQTMHTQSIAHRTEDHTAEVASLPAAQDGHDDGGLSTKGEPRHDMQTVEDSLRLMWNAPSLRHSPTERSRC